MLQILAKIQEVCKLEGVDYSDDGLEAIVFTAQEQFSIQRLHISSN